MIELEVEMEILFGMVSNFFSMFRTLNYAECF